MPKTRPGVAPADLLRADFKMLDDRDTLRTNWSCEQLILMQSVQGRAHEGHGSFRRRRFPDTTMDDIARALRLHPAQVRATRQELIDEVAAYVARMLDGEPPKHLLNADDAPLFGCSTLRYLQVEPADVLRGLYLGGLRDDSQVRLEVEEETGIQIGGGKSYLIDREVMWRMGLDSDRLAHGEWADKIAEFEEKGLIVGPERREDEEVSYEYIRHRRGYGASDDAAIVAAGFRWGLGVAVGVFLADAIDTLEKYVPIASDQDEEIAGRIEQDFAELQIGRAEAKQLTLWATAEPVDGYDVPDSSLRHLLAIDTRLDLCAIESHLLTVMGTPCSDIGLSHERSSSHQFYRYLRRRMERLA